MAKPPRKPDAQTTDPSTEILGWSFAPDWVQLDHWISVLRSDPRRYGVDGCRLCKRTAVTVGFFVPYLGTDIAFLIDTPQNKTRFVFFGLCRRCADLPVEVRGPKVEEAIRAKCSKFDPKSMQ